MAFRWPFLTIRLSDYPTTRLIALQPLPPHQRILVWLDETAAGDRNDSVLYSLLSPLLACLVDVLRNTYGRYYDNYPAVPAFFYLPDGCHNAWLRPSESSPK